jgi:hypothetical protein
MDGETRHVRQVSQSRNTTKVKKKPRIYFSGKLSLVLCNLINDEPYTEAIEGKMDH